MTENKSLNVGQQSLLGYLPATVIQNIIENRLDFGSRDSDWKNSMPQHYMMKTVALFADISGFTKLGEAYAKKGRIGPEFLAFSLNRYMDELINIIGKSGGDIFKFAGDALLVIWPELKKGTINLTEACQRAIQCGLEIQSKLHNVELAGGQKLSIKVGIGVGECTILVVGGQFRRCEYLSVGEALAQSCICETKALGGGETICHENVKNLVPNVFEYELCTGVDAYGNPYDDAEGRFYRIKRQLGERIATKADTYLMRSQFSSEKIIQKSHLLKSFVPAAITNYLDIEKESWSREIRLVSIMFLNLSISLEDTRTTEGVQLIQKITNCVQRCIYRTRGALNKFLMDEKGSLMLICWGLPPMSANDDHVKAVYTGLSLMEHLKEYNCGALMGITTGTCFTGVVGASGGRREYSLLGGVVNLSARFMQKSCEKAKEHKFKYLCLLDETTKDLIQSKIVCEYMYEGELKGFVGVNWLFFEPKYNLKDDKSYQIHNPFPEIRTLKHNVPYGKLHPNQKDDKNTYFIKKSLPMVGRKFEFETCLSDLEQIYKLNKNDIILVKGYTGSGKSHFIRKVLWQFLESNRELRTRNSTKQLIFCSYQTPITFTVPINGWKTILTDMYQILKAQNVGKMKFTLKQDGEKYEFNCDSIGKIILENLSYSYINYLNEILDTDLKVHYDSNPKFEKNYFIAPLPERDAFFDPRKFDKFEKYVIDFFFGLVKLYSIQINETSKQSNLNYPLVFVLEDCQAIDEMSILFIKKLLESDLKGIGIICSYQEPLIPLLKSPLDKITKLLEVVNPDKSYSLNGFTEESEISDLIKSHLNDTINITSIDSHLIKILLQKSFKGTPIFIIDLVETFLNAKLIEFPNQQLITYKELDNMDKYNDWNEFNLPIRFEKIIGEIIDSLNVKEIVILKYACVIGNIFDLEKLSKILPFNNINDEDLFQILTKFEANGIIEFLHNFKIKTLVCKFAIPFFNVVLYQRMLIEQRNEIHLNVARCLQHNKFSFMPQKDEIRVLTKHLKITEKSIINYMEEKEDSKDKKNKSEKTSFNLNNLKILYVKELCEKIKAIDLRLGLTEEENYKPNNIQFLKSGKLDKKSDSGPTWESRFAIITKNKFYYWYKETEYEENKLPLGAFYLKNIYSAEIMSDYSIGGRPNLFTIQISSWIKKDVTKGARAYFFSVPKKSELYSWVIYLNFLRVKNIYDSFTVQFGQISLPLDYECVASAKFKKQMKDKFKQNTIAPVVKSNNSSNYAQFVNLRQSRPDKTLGIKQDNQLEKKTTVENKGRGTVYKRSSIMIGGIGESTNEEVEQNNRFIKFKSNLEVVFNCGYITIILVLQDIIFNLNSVGNRAEEKIIFIPKGLVFPKMINDFIISSSPSIGSISSPEKLKEIIMNRNNVSPFRQSIDNGLLRSPNKIKEEIEEDNISERSEGNYSNRSNTSDEKDLKDLIKDKQESPKIERKETSVKKDKDETPDLIIPKTSKQDWETSNKRKTIVKVYDDEVLDDNKIRKTFSTIIEDESKKIHDRFLQLPQKEKESWFGTDYEAHVPIVDKLKYLDDSDEEDEYLNFFQNGSTSLIGKQTSK